MSWIDLPADEVHVWASSRDDASDAAVAAFRRTLTPAEISRADRFVSPLDRRRFAVGRGRLRLILSRYLDQDPASIRFRTNAHGKPALASTDADADADRDHPIRFNLSHTAGALLLAVTLGRDLGVDIEEVRPTFGGEAIARRFFAPEEVATLLALPESDRTLAFFHGWTRKEAYIKAQGLGLALPLDEFAVAIHPDHPAGLLATRPDPLEAARWRLIALPSPPDHVAALCVRGADWTLRHRGWTD